MSTIERIGDTLVAMNQDGDVLATHRIGANRGERRKAKAWINALPFAVEIAAAYRLI